MKRRQAARAKGAAPTKDQLDLFEANGAPGDAVREALQPLKKQARDQKGSITRQISDRPSKGSILTIKTNEISGALIDTRTAACRLGIGVSTLEKMRRLQRGPAFVRLAKNVVRYRVQDLDAWVASQVRR